MKPEKDIPWDGSPDSPEVQGMMGKHATPSTNKTYWDIETRGLPLAEASQFMPTDWSFGNLKDPVKIEAARIEKREEWLEKTAISALTGEVLAIGIKDDAGFLILEGEEVDILREFWLRWNDHKRTFYGFNTHGFDIPFLIRRSWKWNIDPGFRVPDKLWGFNNSIDLMAKWSFGDKQDRISLKNLLLHLGLPPKTGRGAEFANLWHTDRTAAIEYLKLDVESLELIAAMMGV